MIRPRRRAMAVGQAPPITEAVSANPPVALVTGAAEAPLLEDADGPLGEPAEETIVDEQVGIASAPDVHAGWVELVERIRSERTDGMEELYQLF